MVQQVEQERVIVLTGGIFKSQIYSLQIISIVSYDAPPSTQHHPLCQDTIIDWMPVSYLSNSDVDFDTTNQLARLTAKGPAQCNSWCYFTAEYNQEWGEKSCYISLEYIVFMQKPPTNSKWQIDIYIYFMTVSLFIFSILYSHLFILENTSL